MRDNDLMEKSPEAKAARKDKSFTEFMEKAETKMILSLVPAGDHPDAVKTLLRAAFDSGSNHGAGDLLGDVLGAMLKAPRRDEDRKF